MQTSVNIEIPDGWAKADDTMRAPERYEHWLSPDGKTVHVCKENNKQADGSIPCWTNEPRLILRKLEPAPTPLMCELGEVKGKGVTFLAQREYRARVELSDGFLWIGLVGDSYAALNPEQQLALAAILQRTGNGGSLAKPAEERRSKPYWLSVYRDGTVISHSSRSCAESYMGINRVAITGPHTVPLT